MVGGSVIFTVVKVEVDGRSESLVAFCQLQIILDIEEVRRIIHHIVRGCRRFVIEEQQVLIVYDLLAHL